jgi:glutaredoxin
LRVVVYRKVGCHLCEEVIAALEKIRIEKHLELSSQDITSNPELFERYKDMIPVVEINGKIKLAGSVLSSSYTREEVLRRALS